MVKLEDFPAFSQLILKTPSVNLSVLQIVTRQITVAAKKIVHGYVKYMLLCNPVHIHNDPLSC